LDPPSNSTETTMKASWVASFAGLRRAGLLHSAAATACMSVGLRASNGRAQTGAARYPAECGFGAHA